jgi:predicted PurR-regulated permease PerM
LPLAVAVVVSAAVLVTGAITVLFMTQLADVALNLTGYQANLQQKIKDVRGLAEGGGALSRFVAMIASLAKDLTPATGATEAPLRVQAGGDSSFAIVTAFVGPTLHVVLTLGIVIILVVFILLDRDHLSDQLVRLFGASDVHATSEAIGDAGGRVARMLSLQLVTNVGFAVVVGLGLFALGLPNAVLWGLMAGGLRFVPYVGTALGAVLPTVIAFAVMPGWADPLLVLGWIVVCDLVVGQIVEPLLFGDSTGVTPLALILSAMFWGMLWGPVGLLLSTPITICLLVLATHAPHLGFLQVMLGAEPALSPHQQIYRRLIRKAVTEASAVALSEIEAKGPDQGLDDGMGRMVVLAAADHARDRLNAEQVEAIVDGTDEVLDFLAEDVADKDPAVSGDTPSPTGQTGVKVRCIGGRGQIDDAAASIIAFALRRDGLDADSLRRGQPSTVTEGEVIELDLICYASHPSSAVRRYTARKFALSSQPGRVLHLVVDFEAPAASTPSVVKGSPASLDVCAGSIAALSRLVVQYSRLEKTVALEAAPA